MGGGCAFLLLISLWSGSFFGAAHDITSILDEFPNYSAFNGKLSETRLADEINSRKTITVLAVSNDAMDALDGSSPSELKNQLSIHCLLDYFDDSKLHNIAHGSAQIASLFQASGLAGEKNGFVIITDIKGGKVSFRSFASSASDHNDSATYVKSVKQMPYYVSVIEVSALIRSPGLINASAPPASAVNITAALAVRGCGKFAGLLASSGVIKAYESAVAKGLTVFAPFDTAFKARKLPDLSKLTSADLASLLLYHAAGSYFPIGTLKVTKEPISTLASNSTEQFALRAITAGDEVTLKTGIDSSRISAAIIDSKPLCILAVNKVLLPTELFGKSPLPSPAASPPSIHPHPKAPPPKDHSPPAPPSTSTPEGSPADGPGADSAASTSSGGPLSSARAVLVAVGVAATVISSSFLS